MRGCGAGACALCVGGCVCTHVGVDRCVSLVRVWAWAGAGAGACAHVGVCLVRGVCGPQQQCPLLSRHHPAPLSSPIFLFCQHPACLWSDFPGCPHALSCHLCGLQHLTWGPFVQGPLTLALGFLSRSPERGSWTLKSPASDLLRLTFQSLRDLLGAAASRATFCVNII